MRLFQARPKDWKTYMQDLNSKYLEVGNRPTERLQFLEITEQTMEDIREAATYLRPYMDQIIDTFYQRILASPQLEKIILQYSTVERLKITQKEYVEQFFRAEVNEDYVETRVKIGVVHSEIHLTANYFIMAYDTMIQFMTTILMQKLSRQPDKMIRSVVAIQKLATFDKQLIIDVYTESTFRTFLYGVSGMLEDLTQLDTTQQLIEGMEDQISETHSVTAATEEMTASIQDVANHAVRVAESTEEAVQTANNSRSIIGEALHDIEEVGRVYDVVIQDVNHLEQQIEHTHEVISVIKAIADQTNLLALNASIEAARAGEYGKGFAVVATEVRKLSEHTKNQIEQITQNMEGLQQVSRNVTARIQETGKSVDKSVSESVRAGSELENIVTVMEAISGQTAQIAAMSEEQSSAVTEISERNANMFEVSQQVQRLAQDTATVIYDLSMDMNDYRLTFMDGNLMESQEDVIEVAKTDHLLWKWNIYNLILGVASISRDELTSHTDCRLGKWYYGEQGKQLQHEAIYKELEAPHKDVHHCAKLALEEYERGNIDKAKEALGRLEAASETVVHLLEKMKNKL